MSVASEVRSELRPRSSSWRRCSGLSSGNAAADQHRRRDQQQHAQLDRGAQHDERDHQVGDQLGARAGQDLGERAELVGVAGRDAQHLAGRRTPREDVAHLRGLAGDHLHRPVERDQPGAHDVGVHEDAEQGARQASPPAGARPTSAWCRSRPARCPRRSRGRRSTAPPSAAAARTSRAPWWSGSPATGSSASRSGTASGCACPAQQWARPRRARRRCRSPVGSRASLVQSRWAHRQRANQYPVVDARLAGPRSRTPS